MKLKGLLLAIATVFSAVGCGVNSEDVSDTQGRSPTGEHRYTLAISRATNRMTLWSAKTKKPVAGWINVPVITGSDFSTPSGVFYVETKVKCPEWNHPELGSAGPCAANNPLGRRWIQWNTSSYGVHGNSNESLFNLPDNSRRLSHGCIRMRNADVERLFEIVGRGDKVQID